MPMAAADTPGDALPQFTTYAEASSFTVDYQPISAFGDAFCTEERGRVKVAYAAINQQGQRFLTQYTNYLERVPVSSLSRDDQLAFWLNTRNMLIIQAMAESPNRRRLQRLRGTADAPGELWTAKRVTIDGVELSIDDIEKNIILANWSDTPNILYGLYQGSQGGASLREGGFSGANVHAELEAAGQKFVNSRTGVRVRRGKAQLPEIYTWYGDELFGGDQQAMVTHVSALAESGTATKLADATAFDTRKFSYSSDEFVIRQQSAPVGGVTGGGGGGYSGS